MANVMILTDSTAYIPDELIKQYPIEVIPLTLIWEGNSYKDGVDITPDEFYVKLAASNSLTKTSQVSFHEYELAFQKLIDQGYEVLNLGLSSEISSSYFSAAQAAKSFDNEKVALFDTKLVSMALGFQVL